MIGLLHGTVQEKAPTTVIVDTGGVGYFVEVPLSTYYDIGELGSKIRLHIHTHVREDTLSLFGFSTIGERFIFRKLIAISGVGPKLALAIIGGVGPAELLDAIDAGDLVRLVQIPGVGKKTAERLIIELKDKLLELRSELGATAPDDQAGLTTSLQLDVISALENLGYRRIVAEKAVRVSIQEGGTQVAFEQLLKKALAILTG